MRKRVLNVAYINRDSYTFLRRTSEIRNFLITIVIYDGTT